MEWQQSASLAIVGVTAGLFLRQKLRRRTFDFKRDTQCGCSSAGTAVPRHSVVFHARKGERPQVVVKMK